MKFVKALDLIAMFVCGSGCSIEDEDVMYVASEILSENCDKDAVADTTTLKSVFLDVEVEDMEPVRKHTHAKSAAVRSTASNLMEVIAKTAGKTPVFYQGSSADVRRGRLITRTYHWAKDFMAPARPPVDNPEAVVMVDVDYYVDMERKLVRDFCPHLLYTFQPSGVCKDSGEYKYTFTEDNKVIYHVSGGGHYEHRVWNWDGDSLRVEKPGIFGRPKKLATYAIERRMMDSDHQVILLAPLRSYRGYVMCFIAQHFAKAKRLERLAVADGQFTRMTINAADGMHVLTGTVRGYSQAKVPARVDDALASTARTAASGITLATVKSKMEDNSPGTNKVHVGAEVLLEYHRQKNPARGPVLSAGVRRVQWVPKGREMDHDAKPGMVAFMKPLYDGGFVMDQCEGNDERGVQKRVKELQGEDTGKISGFISDTIYEFAELLFGGRRHFLEPVENEVVYERQNRPSQRRILDAAQHESPTDVAKNFVKKEAYANVNDPRIISTINGPDKMRYSAYIYALTDVIKVQPWYAFSKSPREIAERVAQVCSEGDWVDMTDFSRMDGRVNATARMLESVIMREGFKEAYHPELDKLMKKQHHLRGVTTHGIKYKTGYARASGSPETSAFNTLLNAYVCYQTYRRLLDGGVFLSPRVAWDSLGIYGGDDGLSAGLNREDAEKAAKSVGQVLELVRVQRGCPGVGFLARRYGPDVWWGDINSCCDIKRQLAKFHLTVHLPSNITPQVKLQEKCYSFSLTDSETPIIGEFVRKALELYPYADSEFRNVCGIWNVESNVQVQYPNNRADWMMKYFQEQIPEFDVKKFRDWLETADGKTIFCPPEFAPAEPVVMKPGKAVVDGDIVEKPAQSNPKQQAPSKPKEPKKKFRGRKPKSARPSRSHKAKGGDNQ